ncbi:hypothetical protein STRTUCAR8_04458 [Streptomyces turgidiscabies Car8]|uniref:Uncharacterized protein n=1 Tax=Streptomyces turgidiscabies (strain Car8) TaxID=698760 RepID=L7FDT0_STRT8|nr:hypothetical protein STRTUCAR8_04458 [Streptomyces turgidiscabies Car8]
MPSVMTTSRPEVVTPPCRRAAAIPANGISLFGGWAAKAVAGSWAMSRYGSRGVRPEPPEFVSVVRKPLLTRSRPSVSSHSSPWVQSSRPVVHVLVSRRAWSRRTRAVRATDRVSSALHASRDGIRWRSPSGSAVEGKKTGARLASRSSTVSWTGLADTRSVRPGRRQSLRTGRPRPVGLPLVRPVCAISGGPSPCSGACHASRQDHGRRRRPGDTPRPGLTYVTPGVLSPARLAECLPRMADCPSCSVELSMLRASRREDRKRVPQYSSPNLS